jgi:hypothetical protein
MKKLPASNQKSRERSPSARPISGAAAAARGGGGVGGRIGGFAERAEADVPRVVTHQQGHQRQNDERDAGYQQHGASPAEAHHHRGEQGQEQKLPGGGAGREQAQHDAPAFREPAVGDHGPEDRCHGAGAESDHHAPQQRELPRRGHQGGEGDAGGDERERRHHDAPDAESVHQSSDERPGQTIEEQVEGDSERHGRARPSELALERDYQHPRRGSNARGGQEGHERHRHDDPPIMHAPAHPSLDRHQRPPLRARLGWTRL